LLKRQGYTVQFEGFVELCKEVFLLFLIVHAVTWSSDWAYLVVARTEQPIFTSGKRGLHQVGVVHVHCHGAPSSPVR
jgi:hypothetical protein